MSNNFILTPQILTDFAKDGAVAWGGTWDPTWALNTNSYNNGDLTANIGTSAARSTNVFEGGKHYIEILIVGWNSRYGPIIGVMGENAVSYTHLTLPTKA